MVDELWKKHSYWSPRLGETLMDKAGFRGALNELRAAHATDTYAIFAATRMANIMAGDEVIEAERKALEYVITVALLTAEEIAPVPRSELL